MAKVSMPLASSSYPTGRKDDLPKHSLFYQRLCNSTTKVFSYLSKRMGLARRSEQMIIWLQEHLPYHTFSRLFSLVANCRLSPVKNFLIRSFVALHHINMQEAEHQEPGKYKTFGDFFARTLKKDARSIAPEGQLSSPVDGTISQIGKVKDSCLLQAKGHEYSLSELLGGDSSLVNDFKDGQFATIYLSPADYHRVHMPFQGTLKKTIHIPGKLFSVSPKNTQRLPGIFAKNERLVCIFDTPKGPMAVIMVGAINVSSIQTDWGGLENPYKGKNNRHALFNREYKDSKHFYKKGADIGSFRLGSTVICLFGKDQVEWLTQHKEGQKVQMGNPLGNINN